MTICVSIAPVQDLAISMQTQISPDFFANLRGLLRNERYDSGSYSVSRDRPISNSSCFEEEEGWMHANALPHHPSCRMPRIPPHRTQSHSPLSSDWLLHPQIRDSLTHFMGAAVNLLRSCFARNFLSFMLFLQFVFSCSITTNSIILRHFHVEKSYILRVTMRQIGRPWTSFQCPCWKVAVFVTR